MLARSIALRLLLALAVILNGAATAVAGVHAWQGSGSDAAAHPQATAWEPSCHHEASTRAHAPVEAASLAGDHHGAPVGCCKTAACHCTCASCPTAMAAGLVLAAPAPAGTDDRQAERVGYADAALPHTLRPPIGQASAGA